MKIDKKTKKEIIELIIIFGVVLWCVFNYKLFFDVIGFIVKLIMPLIVGVGISFILNVPMKAIEKKLFRVDKRKHKKLIRILSLIISVVLILGAFILIFFLIIPEFIDAINNLLKTMPKNLDFINDIKDKAIKVYPNLKDYINSIDTKALMDKVVGNSGNIISLIIGFISSMAHKIITGFFGFILSIYILIDKEHIIIEGKRILGAFFGEKVVK